MKKRRLFLFVLVIIIIAITVLLMTRINISQIVERYNPSGSQVAGNPGADPINTNYTVLFSHDFDDLDILPRGTITNPGYDPETDPGFYNVSINSDVKKLPPFL